MRHLIFIITSLLAVNEGVEAIGEGVVDLNTLLGVFGGMANIFTNFNKTDVDIDKIMGRWFQMYKAAINFDVFQTNMYCHVSYFSRNKVMGPYGFSMEEAYHVIGKSGPIETYKRDVTRTGPGEYWMYTEEYFYPRQFYILKVGPNDDSVDDGYLTNSTDDTNITASIVRELVRKRPSPSAGSASSSSTTKQQYEYLIATDANRLALMVYARDPTKFYELYDKELSKDLQKGGFGGYVFWNQPVAIYQGADCYYPNEKEVFARRALKAGGQRQAAFAPSPISPTQPLSPFVSQINQSAPTAFAPSPISPAQALSPFVGQINQSAPTAFSSVLQQQQLLQLQLQKQQQQLQQPQLQLQQPQLQLQQQLQQQQQQQQQQLQQPQQSPLPAPVNLQALFG